MDNKNSSRPEIESPDNEHQASNATNQDSQSFWSRIRSSNWWTQIQFWFLLVSILINAVLFIWTQSLQGDIRRSTYTDKSWEAISNFTKNVDNENKKTIEALTVLLSESPLTEGWINRVDSALSDWTNNVGENALELRNKIESYNLVINQRLESFEVARSRVTNINTPFSALIIAIDVRINERRFHLATHPEVAKNRGGAYIVSGNRKLSKINIKIKEMIKNSLKSVHDYWKQ